MPSSGIADVSFALQSAKGTPAASATYRCFLSDGGVRPRRSLDAFETRHTGSYIQTRASTVERYVDGDPEIFARPEPLGLLLYAALGAKSVSGASDPYTHTIHSGATSLPWMTWWRMVGNGTLVEQFVDCQVAKLHIRSRTGQPLRVAVELLGRSYRRRASNQVASITTTAFFEHRHAANALLVAGVANRAISDVDVTVDNGLTVRPGRFGSTFDVVGGRERRITATLGARVTNAQRYDAFHYGSTAPADSTVMAADPEATHALLFTWTLSASRSLALSMPAAQTIEFDGYEADPGFGPMTEVRRYLALRGDGGFLSEALRVTLQNGVASY